MDKSVSEWWKMIKGENDRAITKFILFKLQKCKPRKIIYLKKHIGQENMAFVRNINNNNNKKLKIIGNIRNH